MVAAAVGTMEMDRLLAFVYLYWLTFPQTFKHNATHLLTGKLHSQESLCL
jgi:hypothetical protein